MHAFARVLISGVDARLEIAGAGPQGRVLGALAGELEILDKVSFPGWTDDVQSFLSNAHVFVLPSREEPFGIALLEAMACGVPIVSSRTSGPLEVLNEETALLVDRDDPESLARAITDIARDPHAAAKRAREAQRRFSENFDAKTVIDRYLEVYEDLTKQ
ncbi:MAG: glycosyltransferase family 4 protein [Pseudomonadota bacterium]|nr:glycosyltransferase family 4 protein [Pseudomonadota bacterium]